MVSTESAKDFKLGFLIDFLIAILPLPVYLYFASLPLEAKLSMVYLPFVPFAQSWRIDILIGTIIQIASFIFITAFFWKRRPNLAKTILTWAIFIPILFGVLFLFYLGLIMGIGMR